MNTPKDFKVYILGDFMEKSSKGELEFLYNSYDKNKIISPLALKCSEEMN